MQHRGTYMDRGEVARLWFAEEYEPVVELLRAGDLIADGETETEAYMRVADDRYRVLRTHEWSDEVIEQPAPRGAPPPAPSPDAAAAGPPPPAALTRGSVSSPRPCGSPPRKRRKGEVR